MFEELQIIVTTGNWVWVTFAASTVLIVVSAMQLAKYGDVLAARTGLGGMFIGILLLAGATSLPELLTAINSLKMNQPNLAAGNFFGSSSFNIFILAILDVLSRGQRLPRKSAYKYALSGGLATYMQAFVLLLIVANPIFEKINITIGWVGIDSLLIVAFYVLAVYLIDKGNANGDTVSAEMSEEELAEVPSLKVGIIGFALAAALLIFVCPFMVRSSERIAEITGLGTSFIGSTLVAFVTSLPEMVTSITAIKIGAADLAIGNLFGSNMFNMFGIGVADFFFTEGRFIATIDQTFVVVGMIGVMMTAFATIGNMARFKRLRFIEADSLIIAIFYILSTYLLFVQSVG